MYDDGKAEGAIPTAMRQPTPMGRRVRFEASRLSTLGGCWALGLQARLQASGSRTLVIPRIGREAT